jgi:hypothetical protein
MTAAFLFVLWGASGVFFLVYTDYVEFFCVGYSMDLGFADGRCRFYIMDAPG